MPSRAPVSDSVVARTDAFLHNVTQILQRIEAQVTALCAVSRAILVAAQPRRQRVRRAYGYIPVPSRN